MQEIYTSFLLPLKHTDHTSPKNATPAHREQPARRTGHQSPTSARQVMLSQDMSEKVWSETSRLCATSSNSYDKLPKGKFKLHTQREQERWRVTRVKPSAENVLSSSARNTKARETAAERPSAWDLAEYISHESVFAPMNLPPTLFPQMRIDSTCLCYAL